MFLSNINSKTYKYFSSFILLFLVVDYWILKNWFKKFFESTAYANFAKWVHLEIKSLKRWNSGYRKLFINIKIFITRNNFKSCVVLKKISLNEIKIIFVFSSSAESNNSLEYLKTFIEVGNLALWNQKVLKYLVNT